MPGAKLSDDEFRQLEEKVLTIESGSLLVISGSLPPGVKRKTDALIRQRSSAVSAALSTVPVKPCRPP
jgi:fructose-1-phosphate kinase PfkB-like protein